LVIAEAKTPLLQAALTPETLTTPVLKIDPSTNRLTGKFKPPRGETGLKDAIRYAAGSLWVSGTALFRVEPPGKGKVWAVEEPMGPCLVFRSSPRGVNVQKPVKT
jgi:hypothetical protein